MRIYIKHLSLTPNSNLTGFLCMFLLTISGNSILTAGVGISHDHSSLQVLLGIQISQRSFFNHRHHKFKQSGPEIAALQVQTVTLFTYVCISYFSHFWLCVTLWTVACQAPLSMEFSRQEYWSGLPFPPAGDLADPGIEPTSLTSPALAGRFFTTSTTYTFPKKGKTVEVKSPFNGLCSVDHPVPTFSSVR